MRHVLALSLLLPARVAVGCVLVGLDIAQAFVELSRAVEQKGRPSLPPDEEE